jgi:23S rRNA (adenine2030-N6)-methyltransferase
VPTPPSRYRPNAVPDYSHRFHAGNVGDVWKHCALVTVLDRLAARPGRVAYLETHAGEGRYPLGPTGEWTEGIGRLAGPDAADGDGAVARYLSVCRQLAPGGAYPGSPLLARAALGAGASLLLWERDPETCERLRTALASDPEARIVTGDGLAALATALEEAEAKADAVCVLIDPPYSQKADWSAVTDALVAAAQRSRRACLVLWYPVKSLTRPNAMLARLEKEGVSASAAELLTTPLAHQRQRLNGSGVVVVRPPGGALEALAAAAPVLGARCATRPGVWSARLISW